MEPERKTRRSQDDLIDWFTVSYRTIALFAVPLVLLGAAVAYRYLRLASPPATAPFSGPPSTFGARFNSFEGNVQVRQAGTLEWRNADRSMLLSKSDLIRTFSGGSAEIRFTDGTLFDVRPDSLITIDESSEDPGSRSRQVAATIQHGIANFQTPQRGVPGSETRISTPTVRTTVGDDVVGNILVADSGDTGIKVFRGLVGAETRTGQKVELASNQGLRVDATGVAGPKIALPGVPVLLAPPHQAEIAYVDPARSTTLLAWKAVGEAVAYHVMLDYSLSFTRPVVDRKHWRTGSSMELRGLEVGTYFWKVAAVDKDGVEGSFSDFFRFVVTKPKAGAAPLAPPPLTIETLEARGNILQVKGTTEPGASLTVNGQRIDVDQSGSFNEYITLEVGAKPLVVIRATGINGGVNEQKRPVVISY
jgi:hypothetical protein